MESDSREKMSQFLLKEYEILSAQHARIHQFRHSMGLTLLTVSGGIWAFCLSQKVQTGGAILRFALLLPAFFGFASLIWIVRYALTQTENQSYRRFVIETWFGAGRGIFEHLAVNKYNIQPPERPRRQFHPFIAFFLGFPFQHIMIWTSVLLFVLQIHASSGYWYEGLLAFLASLAIEYSLLRWYLRSRGDRRQLEEFWAKFREAYNDPCPESFKPIQWDRENLLDKEEASK